jgi:hypothetical protein
MHMRAWPSFVCALGKDLHMLDIIFSILDSGFSGTYDARREIKHSGAYVQQLK